MDESLIMELWDTFREYIPEKHKESAAHQYVDFVLGKDIEIDVLEGFIGYDPNLDTAIRAAVNEAKEWAEEEDDDSDEYGETED